MHRVRSLVSATASRSRNERICNALLEYRTLGFIHSSGQVLTPGSGLLSPETIQTGAVFPREGPGLSYALNWSLASVGVTPAKEAFRNLKADSLKKLGGSLPVAKAGTPIISKGSPQLSKNQYAKLLNQVASHISQSPGVYVFDGAVGSSSSSDARTRVVADSPSASLAFSSILNATPTRSVSASSFQVTVYVTTNLGSSLVGLDSFVAIDPLSATVIIAGDAIGDVAAIKSALATVAAAPVVQRGALPLPARLALTGTSSSLVVVPSGLDSLAGSVEGSKGDFGVVWDPKGVARLFQEASRKEPNLYPSPSAVFLLTKDESGAIPSISKLSTAQAAYYFLLGYNGESFVPAFTSQPTGVDPVSQASKFAELLVASGSEAYLVNAKDGKELNSLIAAAKNQKLPAVKTPPEAAVAALKATFDDHVASKFPDLPEGIAP